MTFGKFLEVGARGYNLEHLFNIRMGLTEKDDALPGRLTNEMQKPGDAKSKVPLDLLKKNYYHRRGWDANGIPRPGTVNKLGLS